MNANSSSLVPSCSRGWWMGLGNMLSKEMGAWWRTRLWWVQCLIALLLLNGTMALTLKLGGSVSSAAMTFLEIMALGVPVAAISLGQDSILGERHSWTAAWVLSKPLRRPAFILAKLIAHGQGLLVAWVVLPGTIAYFQLLTGGGIQLSSVGFAGAMGLVYLNLFFYLTFSLMLATLFNGRGPVLGIALLVAWSGPMQFIGLALQKYTPWLDLILPWRLVVSVGNDASLAEYLAVGNPLPTVTPIIATVLWCVLFVIVAIWRIHREEF